MKITIAVVVISILGFFVIDTYEAVKDYGVKSDRGVHKYINQL